MLYNLIYYFYTFYVVFSLVNFMISHTPHIQSLIVYKNVIYVPLALNSSLASLVSPLLYDFCLCSFSGWLQGCWDSCRCCEMRPDDSIFPEKSYLSFSLWTLALWLMAWLGKRKIFSKIPRHFIKMAEKEDVCVYNETKDEECIFFTINKQRNRDAKEVS